MIQKLFLNMKVQLAMDEVVVTGLLTYCRVVSQFLVCDT